MSRFGSTTARSYRTGTFSKANDPSEAVTAARSPINTVRPGSGRRVCRSTTRPRTAPGPRTDDGVDAAEVPASADAPVAPPSRLATTSAVTTAVAPRADRDVTPDAPTSELDYGRGALRKGVDRSGAAGGGSPLSIHHPRQAAWQVER